MSFTLTCRLCGEVIKPEDAYKHAEDKHRILSSEEICFLRGE